jgi:hypothetical protein
MPLNCVLLIVASVRQVQEILSSRKFFILLDIALDTIHRENTTLGGGDNTNCPIKLSIGNLRLQCRLCYRSGLAQPCEAKACLTVLKLMVLFLSWMTSME